jgi:hypothetical protein
MAAVRTDSRYEAYSIRVKIPSAIGVVDGTAGAVKSKNPDDTSREAEFGV